MVERMESLARDTSSLNFPEEFGDEALAESVEILAKSFDASWAA
jgi:hypothetical protein